MKFGIFLSVFFLSWSAHSFKKDFFIKDQGFGEKLCEGFNKIFTEINSSVGFDFRVGCKVLYGGLDSAEVTITSEKYKKCSNAEGFVKLVDMPVPWSVPSLLFEGPTTLDAIEDVLNDLGIELILHRKTIYLEGYGYSNRARLAIIVPGCII